ncbi:hypothetical protein BJY01DRAFT_116481 [Aspergillus pseudoustus]|uniref:Uncharacterized protein n=1 Tax=Aspergillus pseudoustus TaxID=1810923 RepID=A0ABR4L028_9EURO
MSQALPLMPRMFYCCLICGVAIIRAPALPGDRYREPLKWHQRLRVVLREHQDGPTTLSGAGYIDQLDGVNAPEDFSHSYEDTRAQIKTYSTSPGSWPRHYYLHAMCWDILL